MELRSPSWHGIAADAVPTVKARRRITAAILKADFMAAYSGYLPFTFLPVIWITSSLGLKA
jgi:hypothetical protein